MADKPAQQAPEVLGRTEGLSRPGIDTDTAQGVQEALTAAIPDAGQVSVAPGEPAPPGPFMGGRGAAVPQVARRADKGGEHLARTYSRDPEAFPKPTGREEEWRFTPLKRLRGLLEGPDADAKLSVEVDAPEGVTVERVGAGDPRIASAFTPADKVSAYALVRSDGATVVSVPKETVVTAPIV